MIDFENSRLVDLTFRGYLLRQFNTFEDFQDFKRYCHQLYFER